MYVNVNRLNPGLKGSYALSLAAVVCAVSAYVAGMLPGTGLQIPIITLVTVFLATAAPRAAGPSVFKRLDSCILSVTTSSNDVLI